MSANGLLRASVWGYAEFGYVVENVRALALRPRLLMGIQHRRRRTCTVIPSSIRRKLSSAAMSSAWSESLTLTELKNRGWLRLRAPGLDEIGSPAAGGWWTE